MKKKVTNFAVNLDENTQKQFEHCYSQDFVVKASLMPDAHSGYVAPIGSVLVTKDFIVPSWVGYDIGCGMIACKVISKNKDLLNNIKENSKRIFYKVQKKVPMGMGKVNHIQDVTNNTKNEFKHLLEEFKKGDHSSEIFNFLKNKALSHLGSLGDGNHFIELSQDENGGVWVIIHSGSRGIGHKVAEHYMKEASDKNKEFEATFPLKFDSVKGKEYLNILKFGLQFALLNRLEMANKVEQSLREVLEDETLKLDLWCNKNHNHAIYEDGKYIHRKGATPAKKNERGVIPANMKDGCFLVEGLGNKDFIESSSHGAGRKMSRNETKRKVSMEEFEESMKGIVGTVKQGTLDEAPQAYKNIYDVMEAQKESVKVVKHLKPIINWKGERFSRKEKHS